MNTEGTENIPGKTAEPTQPADTDQNETFGMTPNELVHYHLLNPEEPIQDGEISNAKISDEVEVSNPENTVDIEQEMKEEEEKLGERTFPIHTPYDVLGGS